MTRLTLSDRVLESLLEDDVPFGDLTTHILGTGARPGRIAFAARDRMIVACAEEASRLIEMAGARVTAVVETGRGLPRALRSWKRRDPRKHCIAAGKSHKHSWNMPPASPPWRGGSSRRRAPRVFPSCTRKNIPGGKALSIKAIFGGGAAPHRLGLSETILIFDEHRAFFDPRSASERSPGRSAPRRKRKSWWKSPRSTSVHLGRRRRDVIRTEKFSVDNLSALSMRLATLECKPLVATAGGINASNASAYVAIGADILVTSAPYAASSLDVAVRIEAI